jgi:hypothetical protein
MLMAISDVIPPGMMPDTSGMLSNIKNVGGLIGILILVAGLVLVIAWIIIQKKKYSQYLCVVYEKDALGNTIETYDDAGVFFDKKSNLKLLRLKRIKTAFDPDKINYHYAITKKGMKKIAYFVKYGLKELRPVTFHISNPDFTYKIGEMDLNWMTDEYNRNTLMFKTTSLLMQLLPYILFTVTIFGILILMYFLFNHSDTWANANVEMAKSMKDMATSLAQANSGTTVLEGTG